MPRCPRSLALRLLLLEMLIFAIRGWGRAGTALHERQLYEAVKAAPPLWLYVIVNGVWGLIFTALLIGLWRRQFWAWQRFWSVLLIYAIFSLGWFAIFADNPYDRTRFPFWVVVVASGLVFNLWLVRRPKVRRQFEVTVEN
jgi:hypothetical protein